MSSKKCLKCSKSSKSGKCGVFEIAKIGFLKTDEEIVDKSTITDLTVKNSVKYESNNNVKGDLEVCGDVLFKKDLSVNGVLQVGTSSTVITTNTLNVNDKFTVNSNGDVFIYGDLEVSGNIIGYLKDGDISDLSTNLHDLSTNVYNIYDVNTNKLDISYAEFYNDVSINGNLTIGQNNIEISYNKIQKLTDPSGGNVDELGWSVAISSDGKYIVGGAINNDDISYNAGALHVFELSGGSYEKIQTLTDPSGGIHNQLGFSVAISSDSKYIVGGAISR